MSRFDVDKGEENTEIVVRLPAKRYSSKTRYKSRGGDLSRMDLFVSKNLLKNCNEKEIMANASVREEDNNTIAKLCPNCHISCIIHQFLW